MARKPSKKASFTQFEPNKVAFSVAAIGATVILVMAIMLAVSVLL